MKVTKEFLIQFIGLKLGKHQFEYIIDKKFFDSFDYEDFNNASVKTTVVLDKKNTMLELNFKHKGTVNVPCDLTNESFDLPIKGELKLIVRFGEIFNNDSEELLILPIGEHEIDVSQYIYEMIILSVPLKRVNKLSKLDFSSNKTTKKKEEIQQNTDPRWDKLKKLLTDK
jgi:uncharacterized metal-binding protein YceD (DUF177 family)